jgi:hypothetical protein
LKEKARGLAIKERFKMLILPTKWLAFPRGDNSQNTWKNETHGYEI